MERALATAGWGSFAFGDLTPRWKPEPLLSRLLPWPIVLVSIIGIHVLTFLSLHLSCSLHLCSQSFFCSCVLSVFIRRDVFVGN